MHACMSVICIESIIIYKIIYITAVISQLDACYKEHVVEMDIKMVVEHNKKNQ